MIGKLTATVLIVQNLETCKAFYEDKFGLEATFTDRVSAGYQIEGHDFVLLEEAAAIDMMSETALGTGTAHRTLLCLEVKDVDATYTALTAKGVEFIKAPKSQDWGRRTAYFADPEGNLWELWHPLADD